MHIDNLAKNFSIFVVFSKNLTQIKTMKTESEQKRMNDQNNQNILNNKQILISRVCDDPACGCGFLTTKSNYVYFSVAAQDITDM